MSRYDKAARALEHNVHDCAGPPRENWLTPVEEAEIWADIISGRWPYLAPLTDKTADRKGEFIQTFSGRQFWPTDPRPDDVNILDIAHSLAMQCRYAGHCLRYYSVAEHSVLMARYVAPEHKLAALLHDATEAYLVDVPRPIKASLLGYKDMERDVWGAVASRFSLPDDLPAEVHDADTRILIDERAQNMSPATYRGGWPDVEPLGVTLQFWSPEEAKERFLDTFRGLRGHWLSGRAA